MVNGTAAHIKRVRNEMLVALKMLYPAAMQGEQLLRSLFGIFPQLEWEDFRKDLVYLSEKGYVKRVVAETEPHAQTTPWRKRWFRLTPSGVEIADHCVIDRALEV